MTAAESDKVFTGSVPKLYESHLVPLIFAPYAADMAKRLHGRKPSRVLETAAGTGVLTRALASALPATTSIVATDLNQAMLDQAAETSTSRPVQWRQADAMQLPFPDATFDVVACQFGVMFFPDKAQAFAEARRVLKPGGHFMFSVWDRIEDNEFADVVTNALGVRFPKDPPRFLARTPYGHHDRSVMEKALLKGGFPGPFAVETVALRSRADSAWAPAIAFCQGTPLRGEIEARAGGDVAEATWLAAQAVEARFGPGPVDGKIQAYVVTARA